MVKKSSDRRIAFFVNIIRDGAGMINRELGFAAQLKQQGAKVSIISYFKPQGSSPAGIPVYKLMPFRYYSFLYHTLLALPFAFLRFVYVLFKTRPEIIFVDLPAEAWFAYFFRPFFKFKVIFTYHGVADSRFYKGKAARGLDKLREFGHRMLKKADSVVVVSDFLLAETAAIGVCARRIYNGVDLSRCSPELVIKNIKTTAPIVLFIGRYTQYKGALNVVKAFVEVHRLVPEAELVMHGFFENAEYLQEIKNEITAHNLSDCVYMFGPLDGAEMIYRLNQATVFVNGSVDETFCMPLLEAQACGKSCVGFAAGGVPEVVLHGKTGLLARPENIEEFAEHIIKLLTDDELRKQMEQAGKEHAACFTYAALLDQLNSAIDDVAEVGT